MKKIITGCLGIWLGLISCVNGTPHQYIELKSGICVPQEKQGVHYKNAPYFSAELGLSWEAWRLGLQLGYVKYESKDILRGDFHDTVFGHPDYKDKRFTAFSIMANIYHDWIFHEGLNFYVGCGLGVTRLNYRFYNVNEDLFECNEVYNQDKCLLAVQLMCGISYALNDHWSVSMGYRCMKMENVKYNTIENAGVWPSLETPLLHSLEVGLRYSF